MLLLQEVPRRVPYLSASGFKCSRAQASQNQPLVAPDFSRPPPKIRGAASLDHDPWLWGWLVEISNDWAGQISGVGQQANQFRGGCTQPWVLVTDGVRNGDIPPKSAAWFPKVLIMDHHSGGGQSGGGWCVPDGWITPPPLSAHTYIHYLTLYTTQQNPSTRSSWRSKERKGKGQDRTRKI